MAPVTRAIFKVIDASFRLHLIINRLFVVVWGILQADDAEAVAIRGNDCKIRNMAFHSGREAKEFLVSRIVLEAQRENVLLSEVERKMLYFTESGWTLPDMPAVSEDFDRDYDQSKYEKKIAKLIFGRPPSVTIRNRESNTTHGGRLSVFSRKRTTIFQ